MLFLYGTIIKANEARCLTPLTELGKELKEQGISDLCFLQTCHRFECYWSAEDSGSVEQVKRVILKNSQSGAEKFYQKLGPAAIEHLFRVSSGLDTLVLGEYEVLGQIRENLKAAQSLGFSGKVTGALFKEALLIGKKARRETKIACGGLTYASIMMELIAKIDFTGSSPEVLMIGSGKLAREIGLVLRKQGFRSHFVAGRDPAKAQSLAGDLQGKWSEANDLPKLLPSFKVVIGASGAKQQLIEAASLNNLQQPLTIIDFSVPSVIQREEIKNPLVQVIEFETIGNLLRANSAKRMAEVGKVEFLIAEAVENTLVTIKQRQKCSQIESARAELLHEGESLLSGMLAAVTDNDLQQKITRLWNRQLQRMIHLSIENEKQENLSINEGSSKFFPIVLSLKGQRIMVIGGGKVAGRKIKKLLEANAQIEVVAPGLKPELEALAMDGKIVWKKRFYQTEFLDEATVVIAATDDIELNRRIAGEARQRRILVNTVNQAEDSDFIFPALIRRGDLLIAVSTSGKRPALAREIREKLELLFESADEKLTFEKEMKIQ